MFKFGKKLGKKAVAAVIAYSIVFGTLAWNPAQRQSRVLAAATKYDSTSAINYKAILGGAVDYGIVADTILQNSHLETPFATKHFSNMGDAPKGFNIDVDYTTSPALFLIGALEQGNLYFDKTTASELYVEAPQPVFGSPDQNDPNYYDPQYVVPAVGGKNGNFYFGNKFGTSPVVQAVNPEATANVDRLIKRINKNTANDKGWSYFLENRAIDPEYVLNDGNNCEYIDVKNGNCVIDITDSKFDGKVVYINLTSDMVDCLKSSGAFKIYKNPSSIVVFNIEDSAVTDPTLVLNKPIMFCEGEKYSGTTATNGQGEVYNWNNEHSANVNAAAVQKVFNETVIWNVMSSKDVELTSMGGTMLFPNSDYVNMKNGNCSGWIVAKGTVDAHIQFHFLYNGTTRDTYGQMHFALRKAMTQAYAAKDSVVQDTSASINKGDFRFFIQEYTNDKYDTTYGTRKAVSVDGDGIVTFPTLTFYSDDNGLTDEQKHYYLERPVGPAKTTKSFFFKITEDPSKTVPGIENSDGYINAEVKVSLDKDKNFTYEVKYLSMTGENTVYNDETKKYVKMSGVQYDLGAFYNKINENVGALTIEKTVTLPTGAGDLDSDKTFYFTVTRVVGGTKYYYDADGNTSTSEVKIPVTVSASTGKGTGAVNNLPAGEYTVTEIIDNAAKTVSAKGVTYTLVSTTSETTLVDVKAGTFNPAAVTNTYEESQAEGSITINKIVNGRQLTYDDEFKFHVTSTDGYDEIITVKVTDINAVPSFTIKNLPYSRYTVQEISPVTGDKINVGGTNYKLTGVVGSGHSYDLDDGNKAVLISVENTYEQDDQQTGTIAIIKQIKGITPDQAKSLLPITFTVSGPENFSATVKYPDDFTNGRWSQSGVPLGEYTVKEDADGSTKTYKIVSTKVSTSNNGNEVTSASGSDTLNGNNSTLSFVFTNTYEYEAPKTGALKLKKTVDGPDGCVAANTEFTFYVKGEDGKYYDENGDTSDTKIGIKVKAGDSNAVTIDPIPAQKYEITEDDASSTAATGFEYLSADSTKTLSDVEVTDNVTKTAELINKYQKTTTAPGSLKLQKKVDGPDGCTAANATFTFYVKGENGKWYGATGAESDTEVGITIKAGESNAVTLNNIPAQKYEVYEADASTSAETGYEYLSNDSTKSLDNVVVPAGGSGSAELINKYKKSEPQTGSLTLKKTVSGDTGCTDPDTSFTFYVKGANGKWYGATGAESDTEVGITIKAGDANIITLNDIPAQKYQIYEADAASTAKAGFEYDSDNSTKSLTDVDVKAGKGTTAELINKYIRTMGGLSLTKTIEGEGCGKTTFKFYVFGEDGKWYDENGDPSDTKIGIDVPANGTVTITSIPVQKYEITEDDASGTAKAGYEFVLSGSTVKLEDVAVTKGVVEQAELINKYKRSTGSLKLIKTVSGPTGCTAANAEFTFYVKGANGKWYDETGAESDTEVGITVPAGTTGVTISNIPVQKYQIYEADAASTAATGFVYNSKGSTKSLSDVEVPANGSVTAELINKYNTVTGSIILTKTIKGPVTEEDLSNGINGIEFVVKEDGNDTPIATLKLGTDFTSGTDANGNTTYTKTITGLDTDKTYTIEETKYTVDGYKVTQTYKIGSTSGDTPKTEPVKPTVSGTAVDFENDYERIKGELKVTKTLSGVTGTSNNSKAFTFYVKAGTNEYLQADGKIGSTQHPFTVTPGETCKVPVDYSAFEKALTVVESETGRDITGYDFDGVSYSSNNGTVTIDSATDDKTVAITNSYKANTGSLTLKKTISAPTGYTTTKTFKFYVKGEDNKWYDKFGNDSATEVYVEVPANGTVTINNLPIQKYTVTEADATGTAETGYEYDKSNSTIEKKDVPVTAGGTASAELINKYVKITPDTGSLTLNKEISGETAGTKSTTFNFYVKGKTNNLWYKSDGTTSTTKVAIPVTAGTPVKLENILVQKYDITEDTEGTAKAGYELDGQNSVTSKENVDVTKDTNTDVTLTNAYKKSTVTPETGNLTLKKTVTGPDGCTTSNTFTFYVKGQTTNLWYGSDGSTSSSKIPISVKAGSSVTIENIPVQKYDVTEDSANTAATGFDFNGQDSVTSRNNVDVEKGTTAVAELINVYTKSSEKRGKLSFSKTFEGDVIEKEASAAKNIYFIIERTDAPDANKYLKADGAFTSNIADAQIKLAKMDHATGKLIWKMEFNNVPVGKYKVTEYSYSDDVKIDGTNIPFTFVKGSSVTEASATVSETATGSLELKNTYKLPGYDVEISKRDIAANELPNAKLTLTSLDKYDMSGVTVKQGGVIITVELSADKHTITIKTGTKPSEISGLKPGRYELKETVAPEAFLKAEAIRFTIDRDGKVKDENDIEVLGSPIVMIDKADPSYKKKNSVPATGVGTSPTNVIGAAVLAIGAVCCAGIVIYLIKKKRYS